MTDNQLAEFRKRVIAKARTKFDPGPISEADLVAASVKTLDDACEVLAEMVEGFRKTPATNAADANKRALLDALGMDPLRDWDDMVNAARCIRQERDQLRGARTPATNQQARVGDTVRVVRSGYGMRGKVGTLIEIDTGMPDSAYLYRVQDGDWAGWVGEVEDLAAAQAPAASEQTLNSKVCSQPACGAVHPEHPDRVCELAAGHQPPHIRRSGGGADGWGNWSDVDRLAASGDTPPCPETATPGPAVSHNPEITDTALPGWVRMLNLTSDPWGHWCCQAGAIADPDPCPWHREQASGDTIEQAREVVAGVLIDKIAHGREQMDPVFWKLEVDSMVNAFVEAGLLATNQAHDEGPSFAEKQLAEIVSLRALNERLRIEFKGAWERAERHNARIEKALTVLRRFDRHYSGDGVKRAIAALSGTEETDRG